MSFDDGISEERFSGSNSAWSLLFRLKSALFHVHFQHSPTLQPCKVHSPLRSLTPLFLSVLQTAQLLSLLLIYAEDIQDYEDSGLSTVRALLLGTGMLDNSQEGLILLLSVGLLGTCIGSYGLEIAFALGKGEGGVPNFLLVISRFSFWLLHRALLYPCLLQWQKAALEQSPAWQQALGFLALGLGWTVLSVRGLFVGDNNWYLRKSCLYAKAECGFELREIATAVVLTGTSCYFGRFSPFYGCVSAFLLTAQLVFQLSSRFPYLNLFTQHCRTAQYVLSSWMAVCIFLGRLCGTIRVTMGLWLLLSPCFTLFTVILLRKRLKGWRKCEDCESFLDYEIALRQVLQAFELDKVTDFDLKSTILKGSRRFAGEKRAYLLFSQYYYYLRSEAEYALLRLACANACVSSLIPDFQVYHFFLRVSELEDSEERNYLQYVGFYRQTMRADWRLCESLCGLVGLLAGTKCALEKLETAVQSLAESIDVTQFIYKQARKRFPSDSVLKELHLSLLEEVFLQKSDRQQGEISAKTGRKAYISEQAGYSGVDTGVFVISCSRGKFGKIVFANQQCAKMLDTTVEEIEGRDLDDFLPPPFGINHNRLLSNFIQAGEAREIYRSHLFLYAHTKYSVEVTFRFRPTGYRGVPYFVVAIRSKPHIREFALYDADMRVTSHSKAFPEVIGVKVTAKGTLNGEELKQLLPGIEGKADLGEGQAIRYTHPITGANYYMLFASTGLGSRTVRWIYIFHNEKNVRDLINPSLRRSLTFKHFDTQSSAPSQPQDGQDSRAGSATSYFGSFSLSLKGLKLRRKVYLAERRMKIAFGTGGIVAICLALVGVLSLFTNLETLRKEHSDTDSHFFLAPLRMAEIVYFARKMELVEAGIETSPLSNLTSTLEMYISELESIAGGNYRSDTSRILVWSRLNYAIKCQYLGLGSALSDFLTHANALLAGKIHSSDDFFYVYRNGLGELMATLQRRTHQNGSAEGASSQSAVLTTVLTTFLGTVTALGLASLCVFQSHIRLLRVKRRIWKLLVRMDTEKLMRVALPHQERLVQIHGLQAPPLIKTGLRHGHVRERSHWQCLMIIGVYVVSSCAIYLLAGLYGYSELQNIIYRKLDSVHTTSHMLSQPLLAVIYAQEAVLDKEQNGYFRLVPEGQLQTSILSQALQAVQQLRSNMQETMEVLGNSEIRDIYLQDNCPLLPTVSHCAHQTFKLGLESAILDLAMSLSDLFELPNPSISALSALKTQAEALTSIFRVIYSISMQTAQATMATFQRYLVLCLCFYSLGCVLLSLFVYFPYVRHRKKECLGLWTVMLLVRNDLVVTVRRDSLPLIRKI